MTMTADMPGQVPWWKEPTKDQWVAWIAAWLGWTLDAFDFTIFLLIMVPIAESFHVSLIEVTAVFTVTLWLRLVGAVGSGWLADRVGGLKSQIDTAIVVTPRGLGDALDVGAAGLTVDAGDQKPRRLAVFQKLHRSGDPRVR